jgi:hypothetical protein
MKQFNRIVMESNDYDALKHYVFNRPCEKHGALLAKKIAQVNLLKDNPIKVRLEPDGHPYIVDGQGRLYAAKVLGVPYYYEFVDSKLPAPEQIKQYNANSTSFKKDNYVHLYANSGSNDFKRLNDYCAIPHLNKLFLMHNYFNFSISAIKNGTCTVNKLPQKELLYLADLADVVVSYKILCAQAGVRPGSDRDITVRIHGFWRDRKVLSKASILSLLGTVIKGAEHCNTPTEALLHNKLRPI